MREDSTCVNIISQPAQSESDLSAHNMPQWEISKDGDEQDMYKRGKAAQDKHVPECKTSTGHNNDKDMSNKDAQSIRAEPEYLVCTGPRDGEASPGELVLMVASTQSQAPTESSRSTMPALPELSREQAHSGTLYLVEGGATTLGEPKKDEPPSEQMKLNETENDLNHSSPQTRMILQGSTVIFTEQPAYDKSSGDLVVPPLSQPLHMTFDPSQVSSHTVTETPEDHKRRTPPSPSSLAQNSEPNPTQPRLPSVQNMDFLPTFTSQRPPDLPTTMGKRALSNTRNVSTTSPNEHRYVSGRLRLNGLNKYQNVNTHHSFSTAFCYQGTEIQQRHINYPISLYKPDLKP